MFNFNSDQFETQEDGDVIFFKDTSTMGPTFHEAIMNAWRTNSAIRVNGNNWLVSVTIYQDKPDVMVTEATLMMTR